MRVMLKVRVWALQVIKYPSLSILAGEDQAKRSDRLRFFRLSISELEEL